jgi:hypothetical protein
MDGLTEQLSKTHIKESCKIVEYEDDLSEDIHSEMYVVAYIVGILFEEDILVGKCILNSRNYDKLLCEQVGVFKCDKATYWDAISTDSAVKMPIEFKKIKNNGSMWFNTIRYCKLRLKDDDQTKIPTITMIIQYDTNKAKEVLLIYSNKITEYITRNYKNDEDIRQYLNYARRFKDDTDPESSIHFQIPIKYTKLQEMATFKISM